METQFLLFLLAGMVAMFAIMILSGRVYGVPIWKIAVIALFLTPIGYLGTKLMFFIEAGRWDGRSLFGAVFLVPMLMYPVARLLKKRHCSMSILAVAMSCSASV